MKNIIWIISLFLIIGVSSDKPEERIIGGTNAILGQFPYMVEVTVYHKKPSLCGGSIISANYVLTAAHCTRDPKTHVFLPENGLAISAGSIAQGQGIYIRSRKYTNAPAYKPDVVDHDICVITLDKPLALSTTVKAVNLPGPKFVLDYGSPTVYSGWGTTSSGKTSSTLQYADSPSISLADCATFFPSIKGKEDRLICAGHVGNGPCRGDSGGPLTNNGVLVGIISFGLECKSGVQPGPSVFTNVAFYRNWIKDLTKV